ncbi:MAG: HNH endonuclease [Acutalibacteraceae bacterium]|nr:HNH endonuclease [Acutalibacteraceae bacterium]
MIHHKEYITDNNYEDDNVFFNIDNLESLCLDCHNR